VHVDILTKGTPVVRQTILSGDHQLEQANFDSRAVRLPRSWVQDPYFDGCQTLCFSSPQCLIHHHLEQRKRVTEIPYPWRQTIVVA
jgi:hypothetical protein